VNILVPRFLINIEAGNIFRYGFRGPSVLFVTYQTLTVFICSGTPPGKYAEDEK
jgi:hypothetical protein